MERYEAFRDTGLSDLIGRVEPGDEVVVVRAGSELGRVTVAEQRASDDASPMALSLARFAALRSQTKGFGIDGAASIREIRDAGY